MHFPSPNSSPSLSPFSHRSHALFLPLLFLLALLDSTAAAPYYERDWRGEDDGPVFETDSSALGSIAGSTEPPSLSLPNSRPTSGIETAPDRSIRPTTITSLVTVPSPIFVPAQATVIPPTVITLDLSTTVLPETEVPPSIEANSRTMEIMESLNKKLTIKPVAGTGSDTSITFTPDELKHLQDMIRITKTDFDVKRRQLMVPIVPAKSAPEKNDYIKFTKQTKPDESEEDVFDDMTEAPTVATPDANSTVIVEETTPALPMEAEELEEFHPFEPVVSEEPAVGDTVAPSDEEMVHPGLEEVIRPALCELNSEDEVLSTIWSVLQSRIREWGYDREESTVLVLFTFGLLLDSKEGVAPAKESSLLHDFKAAILCIFRACELAMPTRQFQQKAVKVPDMPRMKREQFEFESRLFECRCPQGYVFA